MGNSGMKDTVSGCLIYRPRVWCYDERAVAYGVSLDVSWWPTLGLQEGCFNLVSPPQALPSGTQPCPGPREAGRSNAADLLSVRALRLKWRMIWWSGSGCLSVSSSSCSSASGDCCRNQCRQVLGMDFSTCHTTACEQREGKAQGTECIGLKAQREITYFFITYIFISGQKP